MYDVFEQLLQKFGVTTYQVSKATGIPQSTLSNWKARGNLIRGDKAQKIADYFGVSVDYLMTGEEKEGGEKYYLNDETAEMAQALFENRDLRVLFDAARDASPEDLKTTYDMLMALKRRRCQIERELSNKITELENAPKPVPTRVWAYYGKIAAAGTFVEFADMIAGTKEYAVTDENRNADYTIGISGDSMEPIYYDGDIVFVKHSTDLTIGDIGIFQHDNGIYIKEYGDGELLSKNPKYKPMCYDEGFQCLGKVIAKADA